MDQSMESPQETLWPSLCLTVEESPHVSKRKKKSAKVRAERSPEDDEARIEAAMRIIETAKQQAQQQRMEYGKFLQQKVKMQHAEWKQRELEAEVQRVQAEKQLMEIRQERQRHQKDEVRQYYTPLPKIVADDPQPPVLPHVVRIMEPEVNVEVIIPPSPQVTAAVVQFVEHQNTPTRRRAARHAESRNPFDMLREDVTFEDVVRLPSLEKMAALLTMQRQMSPIVPEEAEPPTLPLKGRRSAVRQCKVEDMFNKARSRRSHATALMLADPPADYLPDIVESPVPARASSEDLMFMTEVDTTLPAGTTIDLDKPRRVGRRGKYSHYNPNAELLPKASKKSTENELSLSQITPELGIPVMLEQFLSPLRKP